MGNSIQKYYKKYDNREQDTYYFNISRNFFIPCPRVCHFCLGYLDVEDIDSAEHEDIETGKIDTTILPSVINSFEDEYDIVTINELS